MKNLFSACLLGVNCKYNGENNFRKDIYDIFIQEGGIPVCPEQLGGLPTPRLPASFYGGDGDLVLQNQAKIKQIETGKDVTEYFVKGAEETEKIIKDLSIEKVFFKEGSPSCGVNRVWFGKEKGKGSGVTSAKLKQLKIKLIPIE